MLSGVLTQKSNARLDRLHFESNSPLYGAKLRVQRKSLLQPLPFGQAEASTY